MLVEALILIALLIVWWKFEDNKKHAKCPPGPLRFPFVGNMPQLATAKSEFPALAMMELSKSYGDIMFLQMGRLPAVHVSSHKLITEIFNHETAGVSRAPDMIPVIDDRSMGRNLGVIWGYGDSWQTLRRFTIRTLRDFGFGKTVSMDYVINEELEKFTTHFNKQIEAAPGGIVKFEDFFDLTVVNILWRLVTGVNYEMGDPRMIRLLRLSGDMIKSSNFAVDPSIAFPFLHEYVGRKKQLETRDILFEFGRDTIGEHRKSGQYSSDPQCFVDVFLSKIEENEKTEGTHYTDDQLLLTILDLFQAGAETSSKTLTFGLLYMLLNPNIQKKVQDEIDSVVPKGTPITMSHKAELPYSHATVLEILRYSTVVPFPPLRKSTEDFYCEGYLIKKDTALLLNIEAVHKSTELWKDPETFRPERFLTSAGTIDTKLAEYVISFGGGKRKCLGYQLADCNLFLYFTSMMRYYKFLKVPGQPDPSIVPVLGMTYGPLPFEAKVIRRV